MDASTLRPPYPLVEPASREEWRDWLLANYEHSPGIWLVYHRPGSGPTPLDYEAAVEEALCFGWIDSKAGKVDAEPTRQLFTPRRPGSPWSRPNKQRIERMLAQGKMHQSGLARIEAAQNDGSWELYDAVEELRLPPDLSAAFDAAPAAAAAGYERFSPSTRKQLLWWLVSAKRPETRRRRLDAIVAGAARGENPLARPGE